MTSTHNQTIDDRVAIDAVHRIFQLPPSVNFTCTTCKMTLPIDEIKTHFRPPHESAGPCRYCGKPCYRYLTSTGDNEVWHACLCG